jgi:hypothetical protein
MLIFIVMDKKKGWFCVFCDPGSFVSIWSHPNFPAIRVTLSGKDGDDAQQYQISDVQDALRKVGKTYEV